MYVASFSKYISFRNQRRAGNPRSQFDSLKLFSMGERKTLKRLSIRKQRRESKNKGILNFSQAHYLIFQ